MDFVSRCQTSKSVRECHLTQEAESWKYILLSRVLFMHFCHSLTYTPTNCLQHKRECKQAAQMSEGKNSIRGGFFVCAYGFC